MKNLKNWSTFNENVNKLTPDEINELIYSIQDIILLTFDSRFSLKELDYNIELLFPNPNNVMKRYDNLCNLGFDDSDRILIFEIKFTHLVKYINGKEVILNKDLYNKIRSIEKECVKHLDEYLDVYGLEVESRYQYNSPIPEQDSIQIIIYKPEQE